MAWHSSAYAPNTTKAPNKSESYVPSIAASPKFATQRLCRFSPQVSQVCPSEECDSTERCHAYTTISERLPPRSKITKTSSCCLDVFDFRATPDTDSHLFHNYGRNTYDGRVPRSGTLSPYMVLPSSCREGFPLGQLRNKFDLTERHPSRGQHAFHTPRKTGSGPNHICLSTAGRGAQPMINLLNNTREPLSPTLISAFMYDTPETERRRSARGMFTQYDIDKPSGWLSDIEGFSLSGDGNASPREYFRYCHMCSTPTRASTSCPSCGHLLCQECIFKTAGGTPEQYKTPDYHAEDGSRNTEGKCRKDAATTDASTLVVGGYAHTRPGDDGVEGWPGQAIEDNRSLFEDKSTKEKAAEKVSLQAINRISCDDPICEATHVGHYPFRHSVSCSKRGGEYNKLQADVSEELHTEGSPQSSRYDHSVSPHSRSHIAKHLSSAVSHDASELLGKGTRPISDISTGLSPNLEPLTKLQPSTQISSFQRIQDTAAPCRPGHLQQQGSSAVSITLDSQSYGTIDGGTTREAGHTESGGTIGYDDRTEPHNSHPTPSEGEPRKILLARTPSWLRAPVKEAADAISPLRHVNTKNHDVHEHTHGYLSNVAIADTKGQEGHDIYSAKRQASHSLSAELPRQPHARAPSIQIDHASPDPKKQDMSTRISKRREVFETAQNDTSAASKREASYHDDVRSWHSQRLRESSTTRSGLSRSPIERRKMESKDGLPGPRFDHTTKMTALNSLNLRTGKRKSIEVLPPKPHKPGRWPGRNERSPFTEITKPTPIAPPNHDCSWKERYLALTAEIRHLKAEMSTRAFLRSPEPPAAESEQRGDHHFDLIGVTTILHFGDRDDVVLNADVT